MLSLYRIVIPAQVQPRCLSRLFTWLCSDFTPPSPSLGINQCGGPSACPSLCPSGRLAACLTALTPDGRHGQTVCGQAVLCR